MQKTERVGAVALLFLLVTIVAVALWDDGKGEGVLTAQRETHPKADLAPTQQQATRRQRAQAQSQEQRDRHDDGLRTTEARDVALLGAAGETATVPGRRESSPLPPEGRRPSRGGAQRQELGRVDDGNLDPGLVENGWGNGRPPRGVEAVVVERETVPGARKRPSRKHKPEQVGAKPPSVGSGATHVVEKHETLGEIAQRRLGRASRWPEIARLNGIDGHAIREGQTLRLPGDATGDAAGASAQVPSVLPTARTLIAAPGAGRPYVIQNGDVLGTIAQRELGSSKRWREILSLNPGLDEKKLLVGTKVMLPMGGAPARRSLVASANTDPAYEVR